MASHDLRDVLNLPSSDPARPAKRQKPSAPRPNLKGLAREVQNLGGDNPISIVPDVSVFKKRRHASRKPAARWILKPFTNSARDDNGALVLRHWRRKTDDGAPPEPVHDGEGGQPADEGADAAPDADEPLEDSAFAKYNVRVQVPQYSEDQYTANLESDDWTREETDYLMQLAKDFDLRWPIIWDRYDYVPQPQTGEADASDPSTAMVPVAQSRTLESLKARYYEVAAKMMAVQKPAQYMTRPEFELYEMMQSFDPAQERARKEFALNTMARSQDEAREEESLLLEIKRILARTERFNEERRELYHRLDYPATDADINSFKTSAGLQNLLQNLMTVDKSKKRKSLMGPMPGADASPQTAVPGSAVSEPPGHHRRESIAASVTGGGGHRDSLGGTPATPIEPTSAAAAAAAAANKKKGAPPPERRKLTPIEEQTYGVTYHDRLGSGPTFRYEKINKLFSHKSGQQQQRINNVLTELDVPVRLTMTTAAVSAEFETLWAAVIKLVDLRKIHDKVDAEIKVEEAKRAEVARRAGVKVEPDAAGEAPQGDAAPVDAAADGGKGGEEEEQAGAGENDRVGALARPGSSGAHKRSASVLSTTSEKSTKRQKK
ncbi:hypothetical protein B0T18DRAFT_370446 [Schizothecium vesticola]|uniref:SWR1-complex protein 4 n=1 Tax=Schizothecium vesticola TaxID=314040 RepID=A0AA40K253_9PEZI|nr:hypothetical protein B0T18DRAFT_370446 [Schizothecium vesticola]